MLAGYIWIFLFLDKVASSNGTLLFSKARSGSVIANVYNLSLDACRKECKARPSCHSINYFRLSKKCQLNDVNDVAESSVTDCAGSVYALKSDWSDDSFASCSCKPGQKCILKDGQPECIVAECKRLGWQESADMNSVGARTRHYSIKCTQDIAQFDRDRTFTSSTAPLKCSTDGRWRLELPRDGPCLFVAAVMRPNTRTDPYFDWKRGNLARNDMECLLNKDCSKTYRNDLVDNWNALNVSEIRLSIFKDGAEVQYVVFNGTGSNHIDWFTQARITSSSWVDIMAASIRQPFSLVGVPRNPDEPNARRFLMAEYYGGCASEKGWLSAAYYPSGNSDGWACDYDLRGGTVPAFLFSKQTSSTIFQSSNTELAEYIYILIQYEHNFLTLSAPN